MFETIEQVSEIADTWLSEYNEERPHDSLGVCRLFPFARGHQQPGSILTKLCPRSGTLETNVVVLVRAPSLRIQPRHCMTTRKNWNQNWNQLLSRTWNQWFWREKNSNEINGLGDRI